MLAAEEVCAGSGRCSAATQGMHDFDPVGRKQHMFGASSARHDLAIDLDRDPAFGQSLFVQELVEGGAFAGPAGLAIQQDFHADSVAPCASAGQACATCGHGGNVKTSRHAGAYRPRNHPWEG